MSDTYDVIIIGGGPGGYNCAIRCGQLGLTVACVEKRGALGGTCLNVGCIPSKALLHASEMYEAAEGSLAALGVKTKGVELDLKKMLAQKDKTVDGLTKGVEFLFKKNKVDYVKGFGRIAGAGAVEVLAEDGSVAQTLQTRNIVLATGSEVAGLPGLDIDEERIVSSTGALSLPEVPKKLIVIGGGYIGLEMGSVWRRLGAEVTVVEFLDAIVPAMDAEVSGAFQKALAKQGMKFELGHKVTAAEPNGSGLTVTIEPAAGGEARALEADVLLVSIGRRPYTEGAGLETVGVRTDNRGFIETDHFKTSAEGVWAVGDCITGPMLAHKAEEDGVAVAELIAGKPGHVNYDVVPGVVYTHPEVATVGRSEEQLKEAGVPYKKGKFVFQANSRARANHETEGFVKVLAHADTDEILGVHMIGAGVGELIAECVLAMEFGASSEDIARTVHAHPTLSEAVRQAAMDVEGWTMQS
ncbi:MAG: dihydrolipoyl dehydrogenase [Caulobacterales bacterium]|nr:dihydrolipoyl dehydrogenase [Caulobacterales bacterium]